MRRKRQLEESFAEAKKRKLDVMSVWNAPTSTVSIFLVPSAGFKLMYYGSLGELLYLSPKSEAVGKEGVVALRKRGYHRFR